jgi:large subunit ribosomal protein L21
MSYAIISVGGKQYRVREGERLLVDRVAAAEGDTFSPAVLLVGGDGSTQVSPTDVTVTAKVVGQQRGPKIRIGKYKRRTGYKRHTGFRAALTQIEIESIGAKKARAAKPSTPAKAAPKATTEEKAVEAETVETKSSEPGALPEGYSGLTVAQVKEAVGSWDASAIAAALAYEQEHGKRKGALAALEAASGKGEGS